MSKKKVTKKDFIKEVIGLIPILMMGFILGMLTARIMCTIGKCTWCI